MASDGGSVKTSSQRSPDGKLLVMSGPSGVGKSSVIQGVIDRTGARFSVSATTRPPRKGEVDGREYWFVDADRFSELVRSGGMLEWATYGGHRYGTPRQPVIDLIEAGTHVVLDIENDGAHQVKQTYPAATLVFLIPPSREELERRLRGRGDMAEEDIDGRLSVVDTQMSDARDTYDHLVINEDLGSAISHIVSILDGPATSDAGLGAPQGAGTNAVTRSDSAC